MFRKMGLLTLLVLLACSVASCNLPETDAALPTLTPVPASPTRPPATPTASIATAALPLPSPTHVATLPPAATVSKPAPTPNATCQITAQSAADVYLRPFLTSEKFGTLSAGMQVTILARTLNDWYGFDPGVAQAGNVGIFRLRWVTPSASLSIPETCKNLGKIYSQVPQPGICYAMMMTEARVYQSPLTTTPVLLTFASGDWAKVLGQSGTWLKLDLADSSIPTPTQGWINRDLVGFNGCNAPLPVLTP